MSGSEVKYFSIATFVTKAGPKDLSSLEPTDKNCFIKLNKILPKYIVSFPITKQAISTAILKNNFNLKKIIKVVHPIVRKKMNKFLIKNKKKKLVILDIPLLLENKINKKKDIIVFVDSKKKNILKKLKKRKNFNKELFNKFKKIQFSSQYKMKKSHFVIKNDFTKKTINTNIKDILQKIK